MAIERLSNEELVKRFEEYIIPLTISENVIMQQKSIQHGTTSCYLHSLAVAYYSLKFVNHFRIKCDYRSLVRGAMLHDYFLYDWHEKAKSHRLHGFSHPYMAARNAEKENPINEIEKNIILRHMFPLTPIPPRYVESIVVCLVDKACSINEIFNFRNYGVCKRVEKNILKYSKVEIIS